MSATFQTDIGLEIHAQLNTRTKIFCGCPTTFGAPPNTQICPVCSGQPGALPVLNRQAVDYALRMALATGCTIRGTSRFARKNYFYPDLPKGYQISQYDEPLAEHGSVEISLDGVRQQVGLLRIHLEEDAGKNIHHKASNTSLVDLNRAGVPLIEIVSEPQMHSPAEAAETMRTLRGIVRALKICDGNMEQGSLRCDANISLRPHDSTILGTKVEIKNLNSFRFVLRALEYEEQRQHQLLSQGQRVIQETRLWNEDQSITESMRSKEEANDYRYFPDPDLPPLEVSSAWIEQLRPKLPELPLHRRARFQEELGLPELVAADLTKEPELADYFEQTLAAGAPGRSAANWILTELLSRIPDPREAGSAAVTPKATAELLVMVEAGQLSGKLAKQIWPTMWDTGRSATAIATEADLFQQSDEGALEQTVLEVLAAHAAQVKAYQEGKTKLMGFFVGQVMKVSSGKANPQLVNMLLQKHLNR